MHEFFSFGSNNVLLFFQMSGIPDGLTNGPSKSERSDKEAQIWERAWTIEEMKQNSNSWSLAADSGVRNHRHFWRLNLYVFPENKHNIMGINQYLNYLELLYALVHMPDFILQNIFYLFTYKCKQLTFSAA